MNIKYIKCMNIKYDEEKTLEQLEDMNAYNMMCKIHNRRVLWAGRLFGGVLFLILLFGFYLLAHDSSLSDLPPFLCFFFLLLYIGVGAGIIYSFTHALSYLQKEYKHEKDLPAYRYKCVLDEGLNIMNAFIDAYGFKLTVEYPDHSVAEKKICYDYKTVQRTDIHDLCFDVNNCILYEPYEDRTSQR